MTDLVDPPDGPREIHERRGDLWIAEFVGGGPLDGTREIREGMLARRVHRRWYAFTQGGPAHVYTYVLVEPVEGCYVEYQLSDDPPFPAE